MQFSQGVLVYRAVFVRPPTDYEQELIADALSETAGAFAEVCEHQLEAYGSDVAFDELPKLDYWLFVRAEELDQR